MGVASDATVGTSGIVTASAMRSLASNAAADPDVLAACEEAAARPGTPAVRRTVLEDIVRQARAARGAAAEP